MPSFTDCLTSEALQAWATEYAKRGLSYYVATDSPVTYDGKLESLEEIDRLMRLQPGSRKIDKTYNA